MGFAGGLEAVGMGGLLTVDEGVKNELAVLLHQVVDVAKNSAIDWEKQAEVSQAYPSIL